jgi:hypothetical protein
MSLKQNYDLSEKDCPVYENYVHAEVCAEIERELTASKAEVARLREHLNRAIETCLDLYDTKTRDNVSGETIEKLILERNRQCFDGFI